MGINTKRVLLGGLAAAVVLNLIDYITYDVILSARMTAAADAFKPGLASVMMSGDAVVVYVITDIVFGLLLVWTYAAIRPRFGPGIGTAVTTAVVFWLFGSFINASALLNGMMSMGLWWTTDIISLLNFVIATGVGASIYKEEGAAAAA